MAFWGNSTVSRGNGWGNSQDTGLRLGRGTASALTLPSLHLADLVTQGIPTHSPSLLPAIYARGPPLFLFVFPNTVTSLELGETSKDSGTWGCV